jgi:hypothetical protein
MGDMLLHNPWVHFYLLYVGALIVANIIHAMTWKPESPENTSSAGVETKTADGPKNEAA